ncbi:enhanced serine sensitivity protein SseB [Anaerorhabdus sp.]|uniref:enhanced serine sensitivity protein SseB n=1 Tax=Anaerorhabdus sp. TaxID=1872524 RepID=UPI002FC74358
MDINKPVTNYQLLNAIDEMRKDNKKEQIFINELFKAKFLCPAQAQLNNFNKNNIGQIITGEAGTISLASLDDQQGKHYLIAFTDWKELSKWKQEEIVQTLILTCEDYKRILTKEDSPYAGFVINPYSANILLDKDTLENIHSNEMLIHAGETVLIGEPNDYPTDMVEKLKDMFKKLTEIGSAYLLWMARNEEMSYLLVIDTINGNEHDLFPKVGEVCKPYLKGKFLDIVLLSSQFGQSAIENQKPFYISSK